MAKDKIFKEVTNDEIYKKLQCVNKRTINIEKHAIKTNGKVEALDKSNSLLWKVMLILLAAALGTGGYTILTLR